MRKTCRHDFKPHGCRESSYHDSVQMSYPFESLVTPGFIKFPPLVRRELLYLRKHRRVGHLRHPVLFSEKVNWRILYDRRPILSWTCDKLLMKEEAARHGVATPKTYWHGRDLRELAGVQLPARWVLKPNHRSALVHFGHGPIRESDVPRLEALTRGWMDETQATLLGEWAYSQASRCLLVEEMIGDAEPAPTDFKVFVFDGRPHIITMATDRHRLHAIRHYTPAWQTLPFSLGERTGPLAPPPPNLDEMLSAASRLAAPFDFMRIDLYNVNDIVYLGEFTPYPNGGWYPNLPLEWDRKLGALWRLPREV